MITKAKGWSVGELFFKTVEEAQKCELKQLLQGLDDGANDNNALLAAEVIISNKEKIVNILTLRPDSRPRARKANPIHRSHHAKPKGDGAAVNATFQDMKQ